MMQQRDQLYQTAAEKAYEAISQKIIKGEYEPGERLVRRQLAQELGMSAIPILEAMKRLEQDGLIEYRAHWGSIVTIPTIERVMDMFTMREALECQVARILAVKATEEQQQQLFSLAQELDEIRVETTDTDIVSDLHIRFHLKMAECTGFPSLVTGLQKNNFQWLIFNATRATRTRANTQPYWHTTLLEHILQKEPDLAEKKMREHIYDAYTPLLEDLRQQH
ncbi:MAG: GntR family transcriptional regulator [Sphaerochaetaceae bacterium]